jgi:Cu/Ag efflux protein CusF
MKIAHLLAAAAVALAAAAHAQPNASDHASHHPTTTASASTAPSSTEGEVRKVDKDQGKVTLKHGPIENLGMPAMTMVFKAADPKMLDALKPGDRVKFAAENINGALTVTAIEAAK